MKKVLTFLLMLFPLLIFALVNFSASVIAYYLELPVTSIEITKGRDIYVSELGSSSNLEFMIIPNKARNLAFDIYDEENNLLLTYDGSTPLLKETLENSVVELSIPEDTFLFDGIFTVDVIAKNYGFSQLTIVTKDGNYEARSDIFISDGSSEGEILGVVFDLGVRQENHFFGINNEIDFYYTYFPKFSLEYSMNDDIEDLDDITEQLMINALLIDYNQTNQLDIINNEIIAPGRGKLTLKLNNEGLSNLSTINLNKNGSYVFNSRIGYNIKNENDLKTYNSNTNLYLMNEIKLTEWLVLENINIFGNNYRIDHSKLSYYKQKDNNNNLMYVNRSAITINGNSNLSNLGIIGPLDENQLPYENIINISLIGKENEEDEVFNLENVVIENGRFNLSLVGKSFDYNKYPSTYNLHNVTLIGASMASLEVDNQLEPGNLFNSTVVNIYELLIDYTAIGIIMQNARGSSNQDRGYSVVNFISKNNNPSVVSNSWRNLDDASGALNQNNFGYILAELKTYDNVIYRDGEDYYVNPIIMIRGGNFNRSIVNFINDDVLYNQLIKETRTPKLHEAAVPQIGGTHPFIMYLLNPIYFDKGEDVDDN